MRHTEKRRAVAGLNPKLTKVVCWTRMQAEAGQDIWSIIARKEAERRAGDGLFFWGVGNAPNRSARELAEKSEDVDVVFSLMKSRPNVMDVAPKEVLLWQSYFDAHNVERPLPPHVLITSRMQVATGIKKTHYALMCKSQDVLQLDDLGAFDPSAYRNFGGAGSAVGSSQVTALIVRVQNESALSDYRINIRARLAGSYWVRLGQPGILKARFRTAIKAASIAGTGLDCNDWMTIVSEIRRGVPSVARDTPSLF